MKVIRGFGWIIQSILVRAENIFRYWMLDTVGIYYLNSIIL